MFGVQAPPPSFTAGTHSAKIRVRMVRGAGSEPARIPQRSECVDPPPESAGSMRDPREIHAISTRDPREIHARSTRDPREIHAGSMRAPCELHAWQDHPGAFQLEARAVCGAYVGADVVAHVSLDVIEGHLRPAEDAEESGEEEEDDDGSDGSEGSD